MGSSRDEITCKAGQSTGHRSHSRLIEDASVLDAEAIKPIRQHRLLDESDKIFRRIFARGNAVTFQSAQVASPNNW